MVQINKLPTLLRNTIGDVEIGFSVRDGKRLGYILSTNLTYHFLKNVNYQV